MSNNIELIIEGLNDNKDADKVAKIIIKTMNDYVNEFYTKVTSKCKIKGKGLTARYSTDGNSFYMDYYCLYPTYSREDAKAALNIFKKYSNIVMTQLDTLKLKYKDIIYSVDKTEMSSSKVGKGLYVYNIPFQMKDGYVEKN